MMRDYLADLGLTQGKQTEGVENVIISYLIDSSSTAIQKGNVVTFVSNNVRKMQSGDIPRGIALEDGIIGDTIKVQIMGIVKIPSFFLAGANYFNTATGELSNATVTPSGNIKHVGIAIGSDEMLIKAGVFIV